MKPIFTVLYQGRVKQGYEAKYQEAWHICAEYFVRECGALGSNLYKTDQGEWIAISRWPDRATRDIVWIEKRNLPVHIEQALLDLKDSLEYYSETELQGVDEISKLKRAV